MASSIANLTSGQLHALLNGPAGTPPPGVIPNFDNPANLNTFVTLTLALCIGLSTLAILIRIYTKIFLIRALAYEDYVLVLAWLLQIGEAVPTMQGAKYGGGFDIWNIRLEALFKTLYWTNISAVVYGFVVFFIKLSILLQYLRIFAPTRQGNSFIYIGVHVCIWTNLMIYLIETGFELALCTPREKIWNPLMETGHCFSLNATFQVTAISNVISDFAIIVLPMPSLWKLQVPLGKKILMTAIFATGLFACVTSIMRAYYTWKVADSPDFSYRIMQMGLWAYGELATGVIISCLPVMPRFFQHVGSKIYGTFRLRTKLGTSIGHGLGPKARSRLFKGRSMSDLLSLKRGQRSSVSEALTDPHSHPHTKGEYYTLEDYSTTPQQSKVTENVAQPPKTESAMTRDDHEEAQREFHINRIV